jgi:beta-carotene 3-hydroxylase
MEGIAYFAHRYLFHGPLWFLHRSHHEPRHGIFEANDIFGLLFAPIAIVLMGGYAAPEWLHVSYPIGLGMTLYGGVYFFIHDMYTHRRFWRYDLPLRWFAEMRSAHRRHHSDVSQQGQEPFGFLFFSTFNQQRSGTHKSRTN